MRIPSSLASPALAPVMLVVAVGALSVLLALAGSGCAPTAPALTLTATADSAPADGLTVVDLTALLPGAPDGAVVTFALAGLGLLTNTNASIHKGRATTGVYAPFEAELTGGAPATATITADIALGSAVLTSSRTISFTVPTDGAPVLVAHVTPDRVVAGGGDVLTIVVDGRRLAHNVVALSASSDVVALPAALTLDDTLHGSLTVSAPASPADIDVTITAEGAAPVIVTLHFIAPDAPAFDLSGTFAEVSYGVVQIGGLVFLSPDPQCVIAPTLLLVNVAEDGAHLTLTSTTCDIRMPSVNVVLVGRSDTSVGPGFVSATNLRNPGPVSFDLATVSAGAPFDPPTSAFLAPLVVGAALTSPDEALPTTADDPRVRDDDGDGQPGVTITNSNQGAQYTVFRTSTLSMTGTIESSDVVDGVGDSITETNIFNGGGISPTVTSKPSPFFMQRVDGRNGAPDIASRDGDPSSISCADVMAYASELEATAPPPDASTACN